MEGLTIISASEVANANWFLAFIGVFGLLFSMFGLITIAYVDYLMIKKSIPFCLRMDWWWVLITIMTVALAIVSSYAIQITLNPSTHIEYTVQLDKDLRYLDFTQKYEVLSEEENGLYIIREKEE